MLLRSNLVFLTGCAGLSLALFSIIKMQDRGLIVEHSRLGGRFETPLLRIRARPESSNSLAVTRLKVLLIHGLAASKSAMTQMGAELAGWGLDCFLIDLPGHGASPQAFSRRASLEAVEEAAKELLAGSGTDPEPARLILIGHSFGASLAIEIARREPRIAGVVAISPAAELITRRQPARLLILLGEFDFPFVRRGAEFIFEEGTGIRLPPLDEPANHENSDRTRRVVVLPWTDHSQGIFRPKALQEIHAWLRWWAPDFSEVPFAAWQCWVRIRLRALFCMLSLLLWVPLAALLAELFRLAPDQDPTITPSQTADGDALPLLGICAVAGGLAVLVLLVFNPWERLGLLGGGYLSGFLCLLGLSACMVTKPPWRETRCTAWSALYAFLAVAVLAGLIAPLITQQFVHLNLAAHRLWRLPWIAASVLPFYWFDEWVCRRRLQGQGWVRLTLFSLSTRLVLAMLLLLGFFLLSNSQFLVVLILPGLLLMSVLCWLFAGWIHQKTGSLAASALFSALSTAWFFSVFFNQV